MTTWRRVLLVLLTALACVGCDQVTKNAAAEHLPRDHALSLAGDLVRLQVVENRGAFLGLGDALPEEARRLLLVGLVAAALAGLLAYLLRSHAVTPGTLVAGALILGGGIGNLADRVLRGGLVIDFLNCGVGPVRTGIFNVADMAILGGVLLLVLRPRAVTTAPAPPRG